MPDSRNLSRASQEFVQQIMAENADTKVTVLLPRREYSQLLGRLLHDRTADMIARVISRIPGASAQIVAYDIATRIAMTSAATNGSAVKSRLPENPIELPRPQRTHVDDLTPQVADSRGK